MKSSRIIAAALLSLAASSAFAQVSIQSPWVRATVPSQKATGAFLQLTAASPMKLVGVSSPAGNAEIHEMRMEENVMRMRQIDSLALPAGVPVELKPGSYHIMLMELKAPIQEGQKVPLTLVFEGADKRRSTMEIEAPVMPLNSGRHKP